MPGIIRVRRPPLLYRKPIVAASGLLDGSESDGTQRLPSVNLATWNDNANVSVTANAALAPDGTTTAFQVTASNGVNGRHIVQNYNSGLTTANNVDFTFSVYAKQAGLRYVQFQIFETGAFHYVWAVFDLQTGAVTDTGSSGANIVYVSSAIYAAVNGFYKCLLVSKMPSSQNAYTGYDLSNRSVQAGANVSGAPSWTPGAGEDLYFWRPKVTQP